MLRASHRSCAASIVAALLQWLFIRQDRGGNGTFVGSRADAALPHPQCLARVHRTTTGPQRGVVMDRAVLLLSQYCDNDLSAEDQAEFAQWLKSDPANVNRF